MGEFSLNDQSAALLDESLYHICLFAPAYQIMPFCMGGVLPIFLSSFFTGGQTHGCFFASCAKFFHFWGAAYIADQSHGIN